MLYHSLQVFDHARDALSYDEEFLTAALLHDVGKGIDPDDHVAAGLEALDGLLTKRTAWLIEHHMQALWACRQTLGRRAQRRLRESEYYDDLLLLGQCDRRAASRGSKCRSWTKHSSTCVIWEECLHDLASGLRLRYNGPCGGGK